MPDYVDNLAKPSRWERLRDVFTKRTWDTPEVRGEIDKLIDAMPATGMSIRQLAVDPKAPAKIKAMMEHLIKKFPKRADLVRDSKFVTDAAEMGSRPEVIGKYGNLSDASRHALNKANGMPYSEEEIIQNIGHEIFGHGKVAAKGRKDLGMEGWLNEVAAQKNLPRDIRPNEVKANRAGEALVKYFKKIGWL